MSSIRYDRLHDTHVIIAPERLHRPNYLGAGKNTETDQQLCPFCEGNESMTPPEIYALRKSGSSADQKGWQTRVVPNLYKAVQIEAPLEHHYGLFEYWEGFGAHEVIIDAPEHLTSMTQWSQSTAVSWLKTLRFRVQDLRCDHRIAYISLFKNEGKDAGATVAHCHTQLLALPFIPKTQSEAYRRSWDYYQQHGRALIETVLQHEEENNQRIVSHEGDFTAYCPFASAYPFEVMLTSKKPLGHIDTLSDESIEAIATLLLDTLSKLKTQLDCFAFNLSIETPPLQENSVDHAFYAQVQHACRFAIRIMPRIYKHAGFELETGIMINPVSPEDAAALLRGGK